MAAYFQGRAGTGKTYLANAVAQRLEKVMRMGSTNKAALVINGSTIHSVIKIDQWQSAA
eukprot:CAMPEP_0182878090 /NCGR_PEP_ID=MMETSP0034_2-20130328/15145_1 /TAXON_ID=156128 /ORGANISM="Nephroselmis pyriformis, Strain CCMP717" /LENGTH=58 /DNA_ID=CAMNT_0025010963 /DNA_START=1471 /DNA_END=1647 /DNA_ORIENTATION=+